MKKLYSEILIKFKLTSDRTKNIIYHVGRSFLYKIGTILLSFILVPLTIDYLDNETYGIWLTLSSFIGWFAFFDIGLGNGLRNKFAEAKAHLKIDDAQGFVSTAYFTIGAISIFLIISFIFLNQFIDWTKLFNADKSLESELNLLLPIVFSVFSLQMVAKLVTSIYQADLNHSIVGKLQFFGQLFSVVGIFILTKINVGSLLLFGIIITVIPLLLLIFLNFYAFKTRFNIFKPKFYFWKRKYFREISNLGIKFFIGQIAALVLFSTDNFIISKLFGPEEVVPYNIAFKYFSLVTMVFSIIISPYWSSFTDAYSKKDYEWIKKSVRNIQIIWLFIPFILFFMIFFSSYFYSLWIGSKVYIPMKLNLAMSLFIVLLTFNMIYVEFINGIGKIKLQIITSIFSVVVNIPLSYFFGKHLGWGSTGVILATCVSLSYAVILRPIQYYKIITNQAKGIWDK